MTKLEEKIEFIKHANSDYYEQKEWDKHVDALIQLVREEERERYKKIEQELNDAIPFLAVHGWYGRQEQQETTYTIYDTNTNEILYVDMNKDKK